MQPDMPSNSDQTFLQAKEHFIEAKGCIDTILPLFQPAIGNYLLPVQYKDAVNSLKKMEGKLQALLLCVNADLSFSLPNQLIVSNTIEVINECLNKTLIPGIERENIRLHPAINKEIHEVEKRLDKIRLCLFGIMQPLPPNFSVEIPEVSASVEIPQISSPPIPDSSDCSTYMEWKQLLIALLSKISTFQTYDGRSSLLNGLPKMLNRSQENATLDLDMMINQLDELGQLASGQWPLPLLIDNALLFVSGWQIRDELLKVRKALEDHTKEIK